MLGYLINLSRKTGNEWALLKQTLQYSLLIRLKLYLKNVLCTSSWIGHVSIAFWYIPEWTIGTLSSLFKWLLCMRKDGLSFQSIWSHSLLNCAFLFSYLLLYCCTGVQHDAHIRWCYCRLIVTRRVSVVEQELKTLPEHLISHSVFSGAPVAQSLIFYIVFCRYWFVLFHFSHCIVWPLICGLWLPIWYLPILIIMNRSYVCNW